MAGLPPGSARGSQTRAAGPSEESLVEAFADQLNRAGQVRKDIWTGFKRDAATAAQDVRRMVLGKEKGKTTHTVSGAAETAKKRKKKYEDIDKELSTPTKKKRIR